MLTYDLDMSKADPLAANTTRTLDVVGVPFTPYPSFTAPRSVPEICTA